jgi:hypothetical protein
MERKHSFDQKLQAQRELRNKINSDQVLKTVAQAEKSGTPFYTMSDLEQMPGFDKMWDNMDAKTQAKVRDVIESPKASNPKALSKMYNLLLEDNEKLAEMTFEDVQREVFPGLSKVHRSKMEREFYKLQNPSASQERATLNLGNKLMKEKLLSSKVIRDNGYGSFEGKNQQKLIEAQEEMMRFLSNQKTLPSAEQMSNFAKDYAASKVKKGFFSFGKDEETERTPSSSNKDPLAGMSQFEKITAQNEFKREFGFRELPKTSDPRFVNWLKERKR